ncbi:MAG: hypothetical protein A2639_02520 [Candidatus Staskawiczbacteria bacterium RIFCSPHIGHO2_01_FULL_34_27]|uniref:IrrE N-terminal-like domain-containing protein n=1 Tax=Candidatus Staskawiczbacteria bacterium RIFCSPHIGHO2_01_FULL_34_27 TaxID=1802199 RepID=A0A1G2HLC0_9BACT|nr:MAG: hypothetical protein A2639_02520 [Candidatus Staskawiczbacteria bacterium RIFCSPHIGHO2_01_FULL_34_27]
MGWLELLAEFIKEKEEKENLLSQKFPQFSFSTSADRWIESNMNNTILEQLEDRKIKNVFFNRLKCKGILSNMKDNFFVQINENDTMEEKALTLGHEIAHIFEYEYNKGDDRWLKNLPIIETFCDEFAKKWITLNGKEKIESFLKGDIQ